jgi:LmbE family N-acetylglucosaminyl deacetylase
VKVLYVSPHPDDVAFSASARLAHDRAAGDVTLLTLFAPDPAAPKAVGNAAARGAEDRAFAQLCGARLIDGGFRDAIVRKRRYRSLRHLFGPLQPDEEPLLEEVRQQLQDLVDEGHRKVLAPLGIGQHVDHQLAHEAARRLRDAEVLFYEDTPYVFTPHQLGRRLDELGAERDADATTARSSTANELLASARTWLDTPLLRELAPAPLHWPALANILVQTQLLHRPRGKKQYRAVPDILGGASLGQTPRGRGASREAVPSGMPGSIGEKLEAVACYPSQWRLFFPSLQAWGAKLTEYSARIGGSERAWRIEPLV